MSVIVYEAGGRFGGALIRAVEVLRVTDQSVFVAANSRFGKNKKMERREAMRSEYTNYFLTWEEAHAFLMEAAESRLYGARRALEIAQGYHGNVKGMRKPAKDSA